MAQIDPAAAGAVQKALAVLSVFDDRRCVHGLSELARRAGLSKSTTHRVVCILRAAGYIHQAGAGYELGSRFAELASVSTRAEFEGLRRSLLPCLLDLYTDVRQLVYLGVLDRGRVRVVERLRGRRWPALAAWQGDILPLHATAAGKVLLAFSSDADGADLRPMTSRTITSRCELAAELDAVRCAGIAFEQEEAVEGLASVAAPIFAPDKSAVAAICVAGPVARFEPESVVSELRAAAHAATTIVMGRGARLERHGDPACRVS